MVALTITGATTGRCSGTVVLNTAGVGTVLTAAHCFDATTTGVTVLFGANVQAPTSSIAATAWESWPGAFDEEHEIAIVRFPAPPGLGTVPLVSTSAYAGYGPGTQLLAVGYGRTVPDAGGTAAVSARNRIALPFERFYGTSIETRSSVGSICQGDSGGALLDTTGGTERLAGVNIRVSTCGANAQNRTIGFFTPEVTAWLRSKGLDAPDALLPDGAACTTDPGCNSGACLRFRVNGGTSPDVDQCGPPSPNNTSCARPAQCQSNFCANGLACAACRNAGDCDGGVCSAGKCPALPRPGPPDGGTDGGGDSGPPAPNPGPGPGPGSSASSSGSSPPTTSLPDAGVASAPTGAAPPSEDGGCQASGPGGAAAHFGGALVVLLAFGALRRLRSGRAPRRTRPDRT